MVSTLVFCGLGAWTLLALAVAVAARRKGLSFVEFLACAMVALPFAFLYVKTCPNGRQAHGEGSHPIAQPAGRLALQLAALVVVVAFGSALARGPGHFLASLEAIVEYGLYADRCAATKSLAECMPDRPVGLIGDVVASTLPATWRLWDDGIEFTPSPAPDPAMARRAASADRDAPDVAASPARAPRRIAALDAGETLALNTPQKPAVPADTNPVRAAHADATVAMADQAAVAAGPDDIRRSQNYLTALGFEAGPIDGIFGRKTADAIEAFEKAHGLPVTGEVSAPVLAALRQDVYAGQRKTLAAGGLRPEIRKASAAPTRLTRSAAAASGLAQR